MTITECVHAIESLGIGRAYIYQEEDRLTLIDTGLPGSAERVFAVVDEIGRKPQDVKQVFVTHHHHDHTGSLADIIEQSAAQVLAHKIEAPIIRGDQTPHPPATSALRKVLRPMLSSATQQAPAARVDRELEDGDEIDLGGGAVVLHVPGHTMGSAALFIPKHKMLFAGDAAVSALGLGPPSGPFGLFNEDGEEAVQSFKKLAALEFDVAFFGHGKPMDRAASILFRRAAEQLA